MKKTRDELRDLVRQLEEVETRFTAQMLRDDIIWDVRHCLGKAKAILKRLEELLK